MKQNTNIKTLIFAAAVSLGAVSVAPAQSAPAMAPAPSPAPTEPLGGLLGSRYTEIGYNYIDLTGPGPKDANGFAVAFNQPLRSNLDLTLDYDWARTHYAGDHFTQQDAEIGATAYSSLTWGRPFALAAMWPAPLRSATGSGADSGVVLPGSHSWTRYSGTLVAICYLR